MQNEKIKFLEMLQAIISRMNSNAFSIKNWFMVSVGGVVALYFKSADVKLLLLALCLTLGFYCSDIFYLWLERCYRQKYDDALNNKCKLFDMDIKEIKKYIRYYDVANSPSLTMYKLGGIIIAIMAIYNMY